MNSGIPDFFVSPSPNFLIHQNHCTGRLIRRQDPDGIPIEPVEGQM